MSEEKKEEQVEVVEIVSNLLKDLNDKNVNTTRHAICGIEIADNGKPGTIIFKFEGDPAALLGMIHVLETKIAEIKTEILNDFQLQHSRGKSTNRDSRSILAEAIEEARTATNGEIPEILKLSLEKYNEEIQEAIRNKDFAKLMELKGKVLRDAVNKHLDQDEDMSSPEDILRQIREKIEKIKDNPASDEDIDIKNIL